MNQLNAADLLKSGLELLDSTLSSFTMSDFDLYFVCLCVSVRPLQKGLTSYISPHLLALNTLLGGHPLPPTTLGTSDLNRV